MYSDYNNYMMYYDDIKRLEAGLKEAMQKLVSFNQRETLFELPLSSRKEM